MTVSQRDVSSDFKSYSKIIRSAQMSYLLSLIVSSLYTCSAEFDVETSIRTKKTRKVDRRIDSGGFRSGPGGLRLGPQFLCKPPVVSLATNYDALSSFMFYE